MPKYQNQKLATVCAFLLAISPIAFADNTATKTKPLQTELNGDFVYKYLVAEIASQRGDPNLSSNLFLDLAKSSRDPRMAERAAKAAIYANNPKLAIQASNLWAELDPDSTDAQQASTQLLVATGKLSEAKPHLQKLLQKEDTRASAFLYLNGLFARQPDKNAVLSLIQELAKPYPDLPEAHFTIAHAAWTAGKSDLAIKELDAADKLRPGWEFSAQLHGQVLMDKSQDSALEFYRGYMSQYPNANDVRLSMARLLVNLKKFDEAKSEFVKLVEASKGNPEILVVVGLLSIQSNDYADAENYLQQALAADFKDPDQIYIYLGQIAEKQKHDDQALSWYNKVQPGERALEAKLNIANLMARTQNVDAAIAMLDDLQDLNNEQLVLVMQAQASLLGQAKRYQEAYDLLEKAVGNLPGSPELIYDYAMAAERIQKLDVTETELRKLIQLKPDFAQAYNALGYTLADRNVKLDEARKLIEKALALSPNDYFILDSMGWVQYRLGKLDKAVDFLRRAYTAQTDPEIAAHLGEVLWHQGKHDEAVELLDTALREYPENETLINTSKKLKQ
ncbi:MAG TPA: tetratricopeptide repeat protein [Methylophilaceae bacterium]|jgi:tetratricopeptide (TPR) repeat protein